MGDLIPRIGISIPTAAPDARPDTVVQFARRAEAAGADSIWILDRLVDHNQEPLLGLAAAAAVTERVRLGTCALIAPFRPPALLAKMVATLDQLSAGRVNLGLVTGGREDEYQALRIPFQERGPRLDEIVAVLKRVWEGERVTFSGKFYQMDTGPIGPRPVQQPHPPLWFGATADRGFRRVARLGDGFIGGWFAGPSGFRESWAKIRLQAQQLGRDPETITPALIVYACVDDSYERARDLTAKFLTSYYVPPYRKVPPWLMVGPADDCVRVATEYFEAGVQLLIIGSVTSDLAYFERLCQEVIPRLTGPLAGSAHANGPSAGIA